MHNEFSALLEARGGANEIAHQPLFFRLSARAEEEALRELLHANPTIQVFDTLLIQLRDLIRSQHPSRNLNEAELNALRREHLGDCPLVSYGVWVYFPWKRQLVHLLDEAEFTELRTNRNRNKITREEQQRLATVSVGIAGLSVGNAIALTLTLEGAYGQLTLADFDRLDLSNMNRVRASVSDIHLPKTVLTARQIYEINPFAQLRLLSDGVTPDNLAQFLDGLDIVIDECDDIRIKLMLREQARAARIPVLMETSDRGMLDVERFDLEPERPILHGLLGARTSAEIPAELTNEQKLPYVLPIVGVGQVSARAAASMIEVEETISTWPQTGAEVILGGATMSFAVRRIALGQPLESGRRYVDLEELLTTPEAEQRLPPHDEAAVPATTRALDDVPEPIRWLVAHAMLAPSGGNSQPWQFYYDRDVLWLCRDKQRSYNLLDPHHTGAYLALGAALKNMAIAAASRGYRIACEPFPADLQPHDPNIEIVATVHLHSDATGNGAEAALLPLLSQRVTNRQAGWRAPLPAEVATQLQAIATAYDCELTLIADDAILTELGNIVGEGDRLRFLCPELHQALMKEVRWSRHEAAATGDGIDLATLELAPIQQVVMTVLRRPAVAALLRAQNGGTRLRSLSNKAVRTASAMGLLCLNGTSPAEQLRGGQAMQELWLTANSLGWAWYPLTSLLYLFDASNSPVQALFNAEERASLASLKARFERLFPPLPTQTRLLLFRLTQAAPPSARSLRLPLDRVLHSGRP
ncbi:MAG: Rv1355c family protein [Blastocatellia bacterium]